MSDPTRISEPCMCGDPECGICGPLQGYYPPEEDEDEAYERTRQQEIDDARDINPKRS